MEMTYIHFSCRIRPLVYHFAWGPMRAKPVLVGPIVVRLDCLLREKAVEMEVVVRTLAIHPACVYLKVEAAPLMSPHSIVCGLKASTSSVLRREFRELTTIPTLWTRDYLVAAGEDVTEDDLLAAHLASQTPRRPRGRPRCVPS
jgi:putative transposase